MPDCPEFAALEPRQRVWVMAFLDNGGNQTSAAITAGANEGNTARVYGWRQAHDPKVLAALRIEAERRGQTHAPLAIQTMIDIMQTPGHKDQFKAAVELANRSGLIVAQKLNVEHLHRDETSPELIKQISTLARTLGLNPVKLLGSAGVIIDAEFEEITDDRQPDAVPSGERESPASGTAGGSALSNQETGAPGGDEDPGSEEAEAPGSEGAFHHGVEGSTEGPEDQRYLDGPAEDDGDGWSWSPDPGAEHPRG